jgi:hypothetical protein
MTRTKRLAMSVLFLLTIAALQAQARTPDEIRTAIKGKMSERHPEGTEEFWNSLGPEALPVLKQMYSATTNGFERAWLLDGLSHFDDPSVGELLQAEIPGQKDNVLKRKQLGALIRSQGEAAYEFAEGYLNDPDPNVRKAVAQGLTQYGGSGTRVQKRLQEYLKGEKESWVRDAVAKVHAVPKTLKQERNIYAEPSPAAPTPTPLPQKSWAGEWKGAWITPGKNSAANVQLTLVNEKATPAEQKWRIELKLPKQSKQDLKERDLEISVFEGPTVHWLEIRSKKSDAVFIAHRRSKE